jgi:hypothetical protein
MTENENQGRKDYVKVFTSPKTKTKTGAAEVQQQLLISRYRQQHWQFNIEIIKIYRVAERSTLIYREINDILIKNIILYLLIKSLHGNDNLSIVGRQTS